MVNDLLCTWLSFPDEDDGGKLTRVLIYIKGTPHLPLILRENSMSVIKWWVDVTFTAHPYCKGHTGDMMYMGSGSIMELKQKINGRILMEYEIVWADYTLPQCLWSRWFIEGHVYVVEDIELHQYNMSAMLMENNGKESNKRWGGKIRVRYFFIKDRIENREL